MPRDQLQTAADALAEVTETADEETADRLRDLSAQLETLATRDRAPDHGRLARVQRALEEVAAEADAAVADAVEEADDAIDAFRETLEGV